MNKNTVLKIARAIYLQDIVSKELFAATFNPLKDKLNKQLGSYSREFGSAYKLYGIFVGSKKTSSSFPQMIKKQGNKFIVYPIDRYGKVILNSPAAKQFNSIQSLEAYCHSNRAILSGSKNTSLTQILSRLYNLVCLNGMDGLIDKYENKSLEENQLNDLNKALEDKVAQFVSEWADMLTNKLQTINQMNQLGLLPIIFSDTNEINSIKSIVQQLRPMFLTKLADYVSKANYKYNVEKTLWQNMETILGSFSRNLQGLAQVQLLKEKSDSAKADSVNNFERIKDNISNVFQHVHSILNFIMALRDLVNDNDIAEEDKVFGDYPASEILNALQTSNTNIELASKWKGCTENIVNFVNGYLSKKGIDKQTGDIISKRQTFLQFLTGIGGRSFALTSWISLYEYFKQYYNKDIQLIQKFNSYVRILTDPSFGELSAEINLSQPQLKIINNALRDLSRLTKNVNKRSHLSIEKQQQLQTQLQTLIQYSNGQKQYQDVANTININSLDQFYKFKDSETSVKNYFFPAPGSKRYDALKYLFQGLLNSGNKILEFSSKYNLSVEEIKQLMKKAKQLTPKSFFFSSLPQDLVKKMYNFVQSNNE